MTDITREATIDIVNRLRAPAYWYTQAYDAETGRIVPPPNPLRMGSWCSGSGAGHEGENDLPLTAADVIDKLRNALDEAERERDELRRDLDTEERRHLQTIDERDRAQDALQQSHINLGGDGDWCARIPTPSPPNSGDLCDDVPELAAQVTAERDAAIARAEAAENKGGYWMSELLARMVWNTLQDMSNEHSYRGKRIGGVLAGCPRAPDPTPHELAERVRMVFNVFQRELGRPDAALAKEGGNHG